MFRLLKWKPICNWQGLWIFWTLSIYCGDCFWVWRLIMACIPVEGLVSCCQVKFIIHISLVSHSSLNNQIYQGHFTYILYNWCQGLHSPTILIIYHTILTFNYSVKENFWKHCGKGEHAGNQFLVTLGYSPWATMFFIHPKTNPIFYTSSCPQILLEEKIIKFCDMVNS